MDLSHVSPEHRDVLRRLHARVEQAVQTIEQLRSENDRLRQRVAELESRPAVPDDKTLVLMDDDREALRERIAGFIDAIDQYLDEDEAASASESASEEPATNDSGDDASHEMNGTASISRP